MLQLSLDVLSVQDALTLLKRVHKYIDIIEASSALIKQEGLRCVQILKKVYPSKIIFADMKTSDCGKLETQLAFAAGADISSVLAFAEDETISSALEIARECGKSICVDLISIKNCRARMQELMCLGVNYIEIFSLSDALVAKRLQIDCITQPVQFRAATSGSIIVRSINDIKNAGADVVLLGSKNIQSADLEDMCGHIRYALDSKFSEKDRHEHSSH